MFVHGRDDNLKADLLKMINRRDCRQQKIGVTHKIDHVRTHHAWMKMRNHAVLLCFEA